MQTGGAEFGPRQPQGKLTFQRRETTTQDEFQIAQLPLAQHDSGQLLGLIVELLSSGRIARDQVLEDAAWLLGLAFSAAAVARTMPYHEVRWPY